MKMQPLAAMKRVLQKRRSSNPEALDSDLSQVPQRSALEASIVKGTDQDDQTSLKNNKEATKGQRCKGTVQQQESEETKRENTEEEEEDTLGDQLEDNQQELVLKKISETDTFNELEQQRV